MLKKTMTYIDFEGVERTEDFYFNLTEAEISEMESTTEGRLSVFVKRIVDAKEVPELVKIFKFLILKAYGVKSPDGRRFMKSEEISKEFEQTQAYSDLYMTLTRDADAAAEFFNGIIPKAAND